VPPSSFLSEPSGLVAAGVATVVSVLLSLALWIPLTWPTTALRDVVRVPSCAGTSGVVATACGAATAAAPLLVPLALALVAFIFRGALGALVEFAKRRAPAGLGPVLAAAMATTVFVLSWAGSHIGRSMEFGILPQIVFPGLIGLAAFATARWGAAVHAVLRLYFQVRDYIPSGVRMLAMIALPTLLAIWLARGSGASRAAFNEQLVVLSGIVGGFLLVQPRRPKGPSK
jgi:hypothetical protein